MNRLIIKVQKKYEFTYIPKKKTCLFADFFLVMKFAVCALSRKLQALHIVYQFVAALYKPHKNDVQIAYSLYLHTYIQK